MLDQVLTWVTVGVTAAIALLNVIAPLTKSEWDNKALSALRWVESTVLKILIPQARAKLPAQPK